VRKTPDLSGVFLYS